MSFGFGVGDFIAGSKLAFQAWSLLKESTGSAADYQGLKLIREGLGSGLSAVKRELAVVGRNAFSQSAINAIELALDECSQLLAKFDDITKKFETSLGAGTGSAKPYREIRRKLQWGQVRGGVAEIFNLFQASVSMIEILVGVCHAFVARILVFLMESVWLNPFMDRQQISTGTAEILAVVRQQQQLPGQLELWHDNKPIRFIDPFDKRIEIPYEWCTTWSVCISNSP